MTEFTELIKSGKIQAAYLQRQATLEQINQNVLSIKDLDQDNPNSRTFNRLESNATKLLDEWKLADKEFITNLVKANPDIRDDESYKADQKLARAQQFLLFDAIDDYIELLNNKGIPYPPDVKPECSSGDLAAILNQLVMSQDKNSAAHDDLSKTLVNQLKSHASSR